MTAIWINYSRSVQIDVKLWRLTFAIKIRVQSVCEDDKNESFMEYLLRCGQANKILFAGVWNQFDYVRCSQHASESTVIYIGHKCRIWTNLQTLLETMWMRAVGYLQQQVGITFQKPTMWTDWGFCCTAWRKAGPLAIQRTKKYWEPSFSMMHVLIWR